MNEDATTPDGCLPVHGQEQRLCAIADELEVQARALLANSPGRVEIATAKECFLGAVRARRAAADLARFRETIAHGKWLMERSQRLAGVSAPRKMKRA